jgi:LDH2 family malate/lactate/ureidoglycolate dehydrogenase
MTADDAQYIASDLVSAEIAGKRTHGVIKLPEVCAAVTRRDGPPRLVQDFGAIATIDGCREVGFLVAREMVEAAVDRARRHGVAVVGAHNFSYFGRLAGYVQDVARSGFVAIMLNSAGPAAVVPDGGSLPVFGTNPIAFGFPRSDSPSIVIDLATAAEVWGQITLAKAESKTVPDGAFTDESGQFTTDPEEVVGVIPFGGAKGSALSLAVEALGGALNSMPTGLRVEDEYQLGALLVAIDPDRMGAPQFADELARLSEDVRSAGAPDRGPGPRVPGDRNSTYDDSILMSEAVLRHVGYYDDE